MAKDRPEKKYNRRDNKDDRPRYKRGRRKVCTFCADKINIIDYKDINKIRRFTTEKGKILSRRTTGACTKHQRMLTRAINRARSIALLPYAA